MMQHYYLCAMHDDRWKALKSNEKVKEEALVEKCLKMKEWMLANEWGMVRVAVHETMGPTKTINSHTSCGNVKCTQWIGKHTGSSEMHFVSAKTDLKDDDTTVAATTTDDDDDVDNITA